MITRQVQEIADVCKMLGDPTRLSIVASLGKKSKSVGMLCTELALPQPTVSHHLGLMRMARLVSRQRKGKQMFYSLNRKQLGPLKAFLAKLK